MLAPRLEEAANDWQLVHPTCSDRLKLSRQAPRFEFGDFQIGGTPPAARTWRRATADPGSAWVGQWTCETPYPAEIRVVLSYSPEHGVFKKQAQLRLGAPVSAPLRLVELDEVDAPGQSPQTHGGWQSYPVLGRSFFCGIEFPVATNQLQGARVLLRHAPGVRLEAGVWYTTRTAVYGASPPGQTRDAFEDYIRRLRPAPQRIHFNYNSWWTSPVPYAEADILGIIAAFREHLVEPYGARLDTFTIDMGWAKNTTLWEIDPSLFPKGFAGIAQACRQIQSQPGLWISPSGLYGQALDLAWAKGAGYEADAKACLAGARYRTAFKESLLRLTTQYGLRQVKFDGYTPSCEATNHGHEPGNLSLEAIAAGLVEVFVSLRQAAPDLWMEPTCFGFDPSPWWLAYCNSVIGTFGDDAPHGRVPCPLYRESYTTARDYYNLKGARDVLCPPAAQEVLGIVHQTEEPFQNDAVVTVLRGHQFLPLYINPRFMTPRRWEFLAALMQWARHHEALLEHTRPILPRSWQAARGGPALAEDAPAPREPYGYAHSDGARALVCLRNPWIASAKVPLNLARDVGLRKQATGLSAVRLYPNEALLRHGLSGTSEFEVSLAPYETIVLALEPGTPRPLSAAAPTPRLEVKVLSTRLTGFKATGSGPRFGTNYTRLLPAEGPYLRARFACQVRPHARGRQELLLLLEGPAPVSPPVCSLTATAPPSPDGLSRTEVRPSKTNLEPQTVSSEAGWRATVAPAPEHWLWLRAPLPVGESLIEGDVTATHPAQQLTAFVLSGQDLAWEPLARVEGQRLPPPEHVWTASQEVFAARLSEGLPLEQGEGPVVPIDGVFLDTLEPVSAQQGWGHLERNRSVWGKPLTIGGRTFLRGLGTHAPSQIVFSLAGQFRRFTAWAGPDQATSPTIRLQVNVDGVVVWESALLTKESAAQRVDVNVAKAQRLELVVHDGGNGLSADHADWAEAMLLR